MKICHRAINYRSGEGQVVVIPENLEDIWHLYNLILPGDRIKTSTVRKVNKETDISNKRSEKVRTTLTIVVEDCFYDADACSLYVKGRNDEENRFVRMGAYHTSDVELNRRCTLEKLSWDSVSLGRLDEAANVAVQADVAAIVMQEGIAHVCLITPSRTVVRSKIDQNIPKKRSVGGGHITTQRDKALVKFYEKVFVAIERHVNFKLVKCVLLCSPGFVREEFFNFFNAEATRLDKKELIEGRSKFVLCHSSDGFKHSLHEVLLQPGIMSRLADTKASSELRALEEFHQLLATDPERAVYGLATVEAAAEQQAVASLLICDSLFRSADFLVRQQYVNLVDKVKAVGGGTINVHIFSCQHITGEQLMLWTGIAAILRFPLPALEFDEPVADEPGKLTNGATGESTGDALTPPIRRRGRDLEREQNEADLRFLGLLPPLNAPPEIEVTAA